MQPEQMDTSQKGRMTPAGEMLEESKVCVTLEATSRIGTLLCSLKTAPTSVMMPLTLLTVASQLFAISPFRTRSTENSMQMLTPADFCLVLFLLGIFVVVVSKTGTYSTMDFVLDTHSHSTRIH